MNLRDAALKRRGERIKYWSRGGFSLTMWDAGTHGGKNYIYYIFRDRGKKIFEGDGYSPGASTAIDSMKSVYGLLIWFTLQPGDVDEDYFKDYTEAQLEWRDTRAEYLQRFIPERYL